MSSFLHQILEEFLFCPSISLPSFDHFNYVWRQARIITTLIKQFSQDFCHFFLSNPNILPSSQSFCIKMTQTMCHAHTQQQKKLRSTESKWFKLQYYTGSPPSCFIQKLNLKTKSYTNTYTAGNCTWNSARSKHRFLNVYATLTFHTHIIWSVITSTAPTQTSHHNYQYKEDNYQTTKRLRQTQALNWNCCKTGVTSVNRTFTLFWKNKTNMSFNASHVPAYQCYFYSHFTHTYLYLHLKL